MYKVECGVNMFCSIMDLGFLAISIAPCLSSLIKVGPLALHPRSDDSLRSQIASWVAWDKATYSASVVDFATVDCFLLLQLNELFATMKT